MNKIFDQAKDKYVANFVVYGKDADKKLYYADDYAEQVTQADAEDAFLKGRLIIATSTGYVYPVSLASHKIKTIDVSGSTASAVEWLTKG